MTSSSSSSSSAATLAAALIESLGLEAARALAEDLTSFLYTQPPAPEKELARLLEIVSDSARANLAPLGARLVAADGRVPRPDRAAHDHEILAQLPF
jgi:hypothetical protein